MMSPAQIDELDRILGTIERIVRLPSPSPLQLEQATHAIATARSMLPGRVLISGTDLVVVGSEKRRMSMPEILASLPFVAQPILQDSNGPSLLPGLAPPTTVVEADVPRRPTPSSEE